jgi:hypothetical protein
MSPDVDELLAVLDDCLQQRNQVAVADDRRCWDAIDAVAMLKEPRALEPLLKLLQNSQGGTQQRGHARLAILQGLAMLHAPEALAELMTGVTPSSSPLRTGPTSGARTRSNAVWRSRPPSFIGVSTASRDFVPVVVELASQPPADDMSEWDRVVEASLVLPTGHLLVDGCLSYSPDFSPRIALEPGPYRVRVYSAGLKIADGDWYRLVLWPDAEYREPHVLRDTMA